MGTDWQQLLQSILIGLIFSYLLAKLISMVVSFKDDNLSLTRQSQSTLMPTIMTHDHPSASSSRGPPDFEADSVIGEHGSVRNDSDNDDHREDDDWEAVEVTELDVAFSAATAFVAASAADRLPQKVSDNVQLQLYGLYTIATEGPCSTPPPPALKMTARAKWNAWHKLGTMPPEDAMQRYIDVVTVLYPTWASGTAGSALKSKFRDTGSRSAEAKGHVGPVFSTFVYEEESGNELRMDAIHAFSREGEVNNLLKCIDNGVSVNLRDSEGRTPLHWAVDRGHLNIVEILIGRKGDINAKDNEGQTPLHYAAVCEREGIAEFLVNHDAETDGKDNDGNTAKDLCELDWHCLPQAVAERLTD